MRALMYLRLLCAKKAITLKAISRRDKGGESLEFARIRSYLFYRKACLSEI